MLIGLFGSPMEVTIAEQAPPLQMELCYLQDSSFVQERQRRVLAVSFRVEVPEAERLYTSLLFADGQHVRV